MDNSLDLSKVISVITENPDIIAKISALAKGTEEKEREEMQEVSVSEPLSDSAVSEVSTEESAVFTRTDSINRRRLLSAFKPYLSGERAKAIDSMITITEILGSMGGK